MLKNKLTCCAAAIAALCAVPALHAQDYDRDHRGDDRAGYEQRHGDARDHRDARDHDGRAMGNRGEDYRAHQWQRGERIPDQYRHREYVVNDWHGRHLHAPPRGYQWVNVNGDYMLVAIATGVIAELALNSR